ncbi:hypothetical protein GGF46_004833 [Coemansia sp. RSA 552]|nr:hypothetical protein GGF46_004833 [Coemansia sp. RSA 552]
MNEDEHNLVFIDEVDSPVEEQKHQTRMRRWGMCSPRLMFRRVMRVRKCTLIMVAVAIVLVIQLAGGYKKFTSRIQGLSKATLGRKPLGNPRSRCSALPIAEELWGLTSEGRQAFVDIPRIKEMAPGESVCVRVVVPEGPRHTSLVYMPLPDMPWDSILLDMVGTHTGINIPVTLQLAPVAGQNRGRAGVHVYEADVVLRDVDTYRPSGYIEFREAKWNAEGNASLPQFAPEPLDIPEKLQVRVVDRGGTSPFSLRRYLDLPLCTRMDMEGRWVTAASLPFDVSLVPPADNIGRVWLPYECRLRRVSYGEFLRTLVADHKIMHWYGDSNTRRALKKITSKGEWCSDPEQVDLRQCMCEDYLEPFERFNEHAREVFIDLDEDGGFMPSGWFYPTSAAENKSRIVAFKWDGLTLLNQPQWSERFDRGIVSRFGDPDTVFISLSNWDQAFMTMAAFSLELERLVGYIETSYSNSTNIVIRTGQYFCCTVDPTSWKRKFSRLRNKYFSQYVVDVFRERLGGDHRQIRVWDVAQISERRPYDARELANQCPSNHVRAELVEVENQVLFNAMCN